MKINIRNLSNGVHDFKFEVNKDDFDFKSYGSVFEKVIINSVVDKSDYNVIVRSHFEARGEFACDNCLTPVKQIIKDEFIILYTTQSEQLSEDDESIELLKRETREIDLSKGLSENFHLALPMRITCADDCKGLCPVCGINLNEKKCNCTKNRIDPRWEGLKKLMGEQN